jgi:hypothetical protein
MNPHEKLYKLKLEYHKLISAKLKKDPELLKPVIRNLRSAMEKLKSAGDHPSAYIEWLQILETHSLDQIHTILCSEDENSTRLRQSGPFHGIMTEEERQEILHRIFKK